MWAPDCAYRNGTYYYYYPHPSDTKWNDSWKIGVATSKYPNKDFKDIGFIEGLGGFALIDPAVFTDCDGQAYIYYGGGGKCFGCKLKDDMFTLDGDMLPMEGVYDFHEAAWVFKREGLYYLSYSDNAQGANNMRYCTSKNPLGPWEHRGAYMTPVGCETTHGSVVEFKGRWYQFYHNNAISGRGELRSVCADELFFGENGEILPLKQTKRGLGAINESYTEPERDTYTPSFHGNGCFENVCGGKGGRANLRFRYTSTDSSLGKIRVYLNGEDLGLMNCIPGLCETEQTVRLAPGDNLIGFAVESGTVEVLFLDVALMDE
jgi:hypothetical protein